MDYESLIVLIIIILFFSFQIGIVLKEYEIKKYTALMLALYFNLIIIVSIFISNIYSLAMIKIVNDSLNTIMIVLSILIILNGINFITVFKNMNLNQKYKTESEKLKNSYGKSHTSPGKLNVSHLKKIFHKYLPLMILILCGFFGISANIIHVSSIMWIDMINLGIMSSIFSFIIISGSFLIVSASLKNKNLKILIGNLLIIVGMLFLVVYALIPNLENALLNDMNPLKFSGFNIILPIILICIIAIIIGFFLKKFKKTKNLI